MSILHENRALYVGAIRLLFATWDKVHVVRNMSECRNETSHTWILDAVHTRAINSLCEPVINGASIETRSARVNISAAKLITFHTPKIYKLSTQKNFHTISPVDHFTSPYFNCMRVNMVLENSIVRTAFYFYYVLFLHFHKLITISLGLYKINLSIF